MLLLCQSKRHHLYHGLTGMQHVCSLTGCVVKATIILIRADHSFCFKTIIMYQLDESYSVEVTK